MAEFHRFQERGIVQFFNSSAIRSHDHKIQAIPKIEIMANDNYILDGFRRLVYSSINRTEHRYL